MSGPQLELSGPAPRGLFEVPPGDWARPGLVDAAFVARSIAAMRPMPDADERLRASMAECLESIRAIERLWLEYFTAESIRRGVSLAE